MTKVLITGGAGFIGSHTADALIRSGYDVRVLDILDPQAHGNPPKPLAARTFPKHLNPDVECIKGDVRNLETVVDALEGVDAVFHFASLTGVGQSMYDVRSYVDTNCTGTATLLEALIKRREKPLKRMVLASSRAVYGEGSHVCTEHGVVFPGTRERKAMESGDLKVRCPYCQSPVTSIATQENRKLNPLSIYGMTKLQQEQLCSQLAMHFQLPVTILRYFNVYGSRQSLKNPYTGVASIFYSRLNANQPLFLYEQGTPERDFVHVADVARANLLALSTDVDPGSCFNVGSGANSSIRSIALSLAKATGRKADIRETGDFRVGDIHSCFADLTRSAESLNYKPEVSLEDGMMEFASWASGEETKDLYSVSADELRSHNLMGSADSP